MSFSCLKRTFLAASLIIGAASPANADTLRIATEGAYPPWNFVDSAGELKGFEVDLAREVCAEMKRTCEIVVQDWDGLIPALKAKRYDVILASMTITEERRKAISFTSPYIQTPSQFAVLKSHKLANSDLPTSTIALDTDGEAVKKAVGQLATALDDMVIGVQGSTVFARFLEQYLDGVGTVRSYDSQENLDLDMRSGRVDAALADVAYWKPFMKTEDGKDLTLIGPAMRGGVFGEGIGAGVRQEDTELLTAFDAALKAVEAKGVTGKLSEQWIGFDVTAF